MILVRLNFAGVDMDARLSDVVPAIERAYTSGKAVYGMKVLGCDRLTKDARTAIRYVFQLGTVHAITIGTSRREHLQENVRLVEEFAPQYPLRPVL